MNVTPTLLLAVVAAPCIWDSNTLDDELRGIPDAHDLVTGRWYRHTTAYYERRIEALGDRDDLTFAEYDDLAVAWERLGDRARAIEVMQAKRAAIQAAPDAEHLYRYHANLGTFFAHDGQLERAVIELERAVELNPDAHFGREHYQIDLIRYVAAAREDPRVWSGATFLSWSAGPGGGVYGSSIDRRLEIEGPEREAPWQFDGHEAVEAVAGMLRFGGLEGPELYRVLGDLYNREQKYNLAWFAWQHALEKRHPASEQIEAAIARVEARWSQRRGTGEFGTFVPPTDEDYSEHRASADAWLAAFQAAEHRALAAGSDPGDPEVLRQLLAEADELVPRPELDQVTYTGLALKVLLLGLFIFGPFYLLDRWRKARNDRRFKFVRRESTPRQDLRKSA